MAQPVDPNSFQAQGELFPVAEQVSQGYDNGSKLYSLSENGVLVYEAGRASEARQYTWFDRTGKEVGRAGGTMRSINSFSISPDIRRLAIERPADSGSGTDLWLLDLERGNESRFTFDASSHSSPVWSGDGARIAFESNRGDGNSRLYRRPSNNTGPDEVLFESKFGVAPQDWSRDGKYIIFRPVRGPIDLWALPLAGARKPIRLVGTPGVAETDTMGQLSPDGRWLAYTTNASGLFQVMVQLFAPAFEKTIAAKWQISTGGGAQTTLARRWQRAVLHGAGRRANGCGGEIVSRKLRTLHSRIAFSIPGRCSNGLRILELHAQPRRQALSDPYTGRCGRRIAGAHGSGQLAIWCEEIN
jgi:hypothetical protein